MNCYHQYKVYMVMCSLAIGSLILAAGFIYFCNQKLKIPNELLEGLMIATGIVEVMVFTLLYFYDQTLRARLGDLCKDTGTSVGMVASLTIFIMSIVCFIVAILGFMFLIFLLLNVYKAYIRRVCCCCGGIALLGNSLTIIPYSAETFRKSAKECAICLSDFNEGDEVSPLYCNIKHIFHTECIKGWLAREPVCPMCKC